MNTPLSVAVFVIGSPTAIITSFTCFVNNTKDHYVAVFCCLWRREDETYSFSTPIGFFGSSYFQKNSIGLRFLTKAVPQLFLHPTQKPPFGGLHCGEGRNRTPVQISFGNVSTRRSWFYFSNTILETDKMNCILVFFVSEQTRN